MFAHSVRCLTTPRAQPQPLATAIAEFVAATMPTATAWLLAHRTDALGDDSPLQSASAGGGELLLGAYLRHRKAVLELRTISATHATAAAPSTPRLRTPDTEAGLITSVDALVTDRPACDGPWRQLHTLAPPRHPSRVPCARPQCASVPSLAFSGPVPLWTPHAVVHYGGYESGDLERFLLKDLLVGVPSLDQVPLVGALSPRQTLPDASSPGGHRQDPVYVRRSTRHRASALRARGCGLMGPDLAELSLVVSPVGTASQQERQRVFLSFASPSVTLTDLCGEPSPARRQTLRTAFGYSLAILKDSLPPPVLVAASALQRWHLDHASGTRACAASFWVSAVAHRCSACTMDGHMEAARTLSASDATTAHAWRSRLEALGGHLPTPRDHRTGVLDDARDRQTLAHVLAASTALDMHRCTQAEWSETYARNFFLRNEDFARCEDVVELASSRLGWSSAAMHSLLRSVP